MKICILSCIVRLKKKKVLCNLLCALIFRHQRRNGETDSSGFSAEGTLISASAVPQRSLFRKERCHMISVYTQSAVRGPALDNHVTFRAWLARFRPELSGRGTDVGQLVQFPSAGPCVCQRRRWWWWWWGLEVWWVRWEVGMDSSATPFSIRRVIRTSVVGNRSHEFRSSQFKVASRQKGS